MDSLTQIVLGASTGLAVSGKNIGNKAALWGAIGGTIPDLDVFIGWFWNPIVSDYHHRGFSHSIIFALVCSLGLAFLLSKWKKDTYKFKNTYLLFLISIGTHPLLDSLTRWGTQLFWPFDLRLHLNSVFVIDPLYTLPFMIFLIVSLMKKGRTKKLWWNKMGLIVSSCYLVLGLIFNSVVNTKYEDAYVAPMPLTSFQWMVIEEESNYFVMQQYNIFTGKTLNKVNCPKNHQLEQTFFDEVPQDFRLAKKFSQGYYSLYDKQDTLLFIDWRFGNLASYSISQTNKGLRGYKFYYKNGALKIERYRMKIGEDVSFSQYFSSIFK